MSEEAGSTGFAVRLDNFEGPFDLLLNLISKHKLDVTEIALSKVTDEFIAHVKALPDSDLEETTSFLLVAATLLDLKAARLLPQGDVEDEEDLALLEARDLLFARLIQYRAFKEIAAVLNERLAGESLRHPRAVMTFSDSGAHVSQISDASIQTYLLSYWVREREAFDLAEAIRMLTSVPAAAWGFADRGRIAPGLRADVNVFDPATVGPALPQLVHDLPAGAPRLRQGGTGFLATIVNGATTFRAGEHTGALAGRLNRRRA